jgi:hypothetical protein
MVSKYFHWVFVLIDISITLAFREPWTANAWYLPRQALLLAKQLLMFIIHRFSSFHSQIKHLDWQRNVLRRVCQDVWAFAGICSTSLRSLYLRCDIPTNPKIFFTRSGCFFIKKKILNLFYVASRFMQKNSRFHGKIARYDVLKIKFVDISHRRYKLRRDIE